MTASSTRRSLSRSAVTSKPMAATYRAGHDIVEDGQLCAVPALARSRMGNEQQCCRHLARGPFAEKHNVASCGFQTQFHQTRLCVVATHLAGEVAHLQLALGELALLNK
jgi:hypothetical protein